MSKSKQSPAGLTNKILSQCAPALKWLTQQPLSVDISYKVAMYLKLIEPAMNAIDAAKLAGLKKYGTETGKRPGQYEMKDTAAVRNYEADLEKVLKKDSGHGKIDLTLDELREYFRKEDIKPAPEILMMLMEICK